MTETAKLDFQSAGATRKAKPAPTHVDKLTEAHDQLMAAIGEEGPAAPILAYVDPDDLEGRAEHIEAIFNFFRGYLRVVLADTRENMNSEPIDPQDADDSLSDLSDKIVSAINDCAYREGE